MPEQVAKKKRVRKGPSNAMLTIRIERTMPAVDQSTLVEWKQSDIPESLKYIPVQPLQRYIVLEQSLPEAKFDLAKVIKAINGL